MVHAYWMDQALRMAETAGKAGEIPVGALIVDDQEHLIAWGQNRKERDRNPLAHAEMEVIHQATQKLKLSLFAKLQALCHPRTLSHVCRRDRVGTVRHGDLWS